VDVLTGRLNARTSGGSVQTRDCEIQFCNCRKWTEQGYDIRIGLRAMGLTATIDNLLGLNLGRRILRYFSHFDISF
jgi:hypothetical protein